MTEQYDSAPETKKHIDRVGELIYSACENMNHRACVHDKSKLRPPEKEILDVMTPRLRGTTYGSDEYRAMMIEMRPMIEHHNANNPHHPEYHKLWKCPLCSGVYQQRDLPPNNFPHVDGDDLDKTWFCPECVGGAAVYEAKLEPHTSLDGMSLFDLLELICDWRAATERHADGDIMRSLEINRKRFSISDQMYAVLRNTVMEMQWDQAHTPKVRK